ncbi:MAG: response regulator transcription factor [Clostridiales bacterium]|nr:response regulator transcription factor [Clostridiales bacterium]
MYRILIVEDDTVISCEMARHLNKWGYEVETVADFSDVMGTFHSFLPHLVLMDIGLPFYNGYYWCSEIRKVSNVPVIFISSAGENMNIVMAVNMGGDDFIIKPFDLDILAAKIQAMLRRAYAFRGETEVLEYGGVILSVPEMALLFEDRRQELTKNEFRILKLLFENPGQVVSRETIMKRLWEDESFVDDNTLTVNINRLRKKLEEAGYPVSVLTKKGVGYQLGKEEGGSEK